ncbi:MAG: hypothetical protein IJI60_03435 [Bacilli bacterium]|nr:hypothetical protein [Bacilli bacterium]
MIKIESGKINYNNQQIDCVFETTDNGKKYIFLEFHTLEEFYAHRREKGNNVIATTDLLEAIAWFNRSLVTDPAFRFKNLGIVDTTTGTEVVPLQYTKIQPLRETIQEADINKKINTDKIDENICFAVLAEPTTPSVIKANQTKNDPDPAATSELVSTDNTIKSHLNSEMGNEGIFIMNDRYSEATIYDKRNGENLLGNKHHSYIAITSDGEKIYGSPYIADAEIAEYSFNQKEEEIEDEEEIEETLPTEEVAQEKENEVEESAPVQSIAEEAEKEEVKEEPAERLPEDNEPEEEKEEEKSEEPEEKEEQQEEEPQEEKEPEKEDEEEAEEDLVAFTSDAKEFAPEEEKEEAKEEKEETEVPEETFNFSEEEEEQETAFDKMIYGEEAPPLKDSSEEISKIQYTEEEESTPVEESSNYSGVIKDAATTLAKLIRQNQQMESQYAEAKDKIDMHERTEKEQAERIQRLEEENSKLEEENNRWNSILEDKDKKISKLEEELATQKEKGKQNARELDAIRKAIPKLQFLIEESTTGEGQFQR